MSVSPEMGRAASGRRVMRSRSGGLDRQGHPQSPRLCLPVFHSERCKAALPKWHFPAWKLGTPSPRRARLTYLEIGPDRSPPDRHQGGCRGSVSFIPRLPRPDSSTRGPFRGRQGHLSPSQEQGGAGGLTRSCRHCQCLSCATKGP